VLLTGLLFFLFGDSNAIARLWPALAGSLLVLLPWTFRGYLARYPAGRIAGLVLAFGLALDPGLVAASRLAGGPMLAAGFGLLALGFAYDRRSLPFGILGGLALIGQEFEWARRIVDRVKAMVANVLRQSSEQSTEDRSDHAGHPGG